MALVPIRFVQDKTTQADAAQAELENQIVALRAKFLTPDAVV